MPVISTIAAATARAFGAFKSLGGAADEFFDYVTLLLHGDGTNGAQNNTFLDSSTNNFTITRNGNTTQGTFSPFSQTGWSNYFDGASDYLTTPVSANLALGGSDFCIEWWEYRTSIADSEAVMGGNTSYVSAYDPIIAWPSVSDVICYLSGDGLSWGILNAFDIGTATANQWIHRALTRDGNTFRGFENGVLINSTTASGSVYMSANSWRIGQGQNQGANTFPGYISNLRMVIGSPVYTAAFTPSTSPLTAIANTSLLTCQSNRFVDNSSNAFAITVNGNTSVQAFSPFAPTAAYSAATVGGSGYFDGSGDYLTAPQNAAYDFGTGDFTIEAWVYFTTAGSIVSNTDNGNYTSGGFVFVENGAVVVATSGGSTATLGTFTYPTNQWFHVAVTRSGSSAKGFINGVESFSATNSTNIATSGTNLLAIGTRRTGLSGVGSYGAFTAGYITNLRIVKGTAVYTSAFTPPTAPLTAISGTSLLCNFTNGGIFDNTAKNVLETVGNAQISTSVKKFGTGSLAFDGTGDYLDVTSSPSLTFGTGDFTVEFWINTSSTGFNIMNPSSATGSGYWGLIVQSSNLRWNNSYNVSNLWEISASAILNGAWHHVAIARASGSTKIFYDGVLQSTQSDSTNYSGVAAWRIGSGNLAALNGYIDDLRITKGVARYTSAFTPPTAAFEDQ